MGHAAESHAGHAHDPHGHGSGGHGAAVFGGEIPPAPAARSITPAPEDFVGLPGPAGMLWPSAWIVLAVALIATLLCGGWHLVHDDHAHGASQEHGHP